MNRLRTFAYGIALCSVVWSSLDWLDRQTTMAATEEGNLTLIANGEDFVRQGFVSKDGWEIEFDRLDVNLSDAVAYSTESFEPQKGDTKESIEFQHQAKFDTAGAVDLAAGEANAEPITVAQVEVPSGFYNALTWGLSTADTNSATAGNTMMLDGRATKNGETIDFILGFNQPVEYVNGEFVGDKRLGIVSADEPGQVETTFHFDHIFGDADTPLEDALNADALGFQPLADLASEGTLELDETDLAERLSPQNYQKLTEAIAGLGHVGEGHCVIADSQ